MNCIDKNLDIVYISSSKSNFHKEYGKMKKIFLAALTAMALCSYSYAQDDEDEYEEDEAPAAAAPAPAPASTPQAAAPAAAPVASGAGFLGISMDIQETFGAGIPTFFFNIRFAPNMELYAILGMYHHGETSHESKAGNAEVEDGDDATAIDIGVGFDFIAAQMLLPVSIGGEFIINHLGEDNNRFDFNVLGGFRANPAANFYITAKAGLSFMYSSWEDPANDNSRFDIAFKTRVVLSWFFM